MDLKINKKLNEDIPTLVADINGTIIHMNSKATTALRTLKVGDNVSKLIDLNYVRKTTMFENTIDVALTSMGELKKAVVKVNMTGATRLLEISLYKGGGTEEAELLNDKRLFSSYSGIISKNDYKALNLSDFVSEIITAMKDDLRFSYRSFELECFDESIELSLRPDHISTLIVGIIVSLNEIEYRSPIKISIKKFNGGCILSISTKSSTFKSANGIYEISELYPNLAMRLAYLASVCENDGLEYKMSVSPSEIKASIELSSVVKDNSVFRYAPYETELKDFVSYVTSLFSYEGFSGTKAEEQE